MKPLSRRTVLRGMGAAVALPFLDAMMPARVSAAPAISPRLVAIEMVHGSAGSTSFGMRRNMWAPAVAGRGFDLTGSSLAPLEPFRDALTIVSHTDCRPAEAFAAS